ncbi:hypothetical protein LguiA_009047 [Lonicera macranthoides]
MSSILYKIVLAKLRFWSNLKSSQARSEIDEQFLTAGNCETTHWMLKPEFFFRLP